VAGRELDDTGGPPPPVFFAVCIRHRLNAAVRRAKALRHVPADEDGRDIDVEARPEPDREVRDLIKALLTELPARQRRAVEMRFGLFDGVERTDGEVAAALGGISHQRANQIVIVALGRLRRAAERRGLTG
jgi:DNA-directed RNA polymerase sigma subunit (sigma70/sigma32)